MSLFKKKPKEPEKQEKTMSDYEAWCFIFHTKRCEGEDFPVPYTKAIRVVLREMGYEPSWIEGRFRHILNAVYFEEKTNLDEIVAEWERWLDEEAGIYPEYEDETEDEDA